MAPNGTSDLFGCVRVRAGLDRFGGAITCRRATNDAMLGLWRVYVDKEKRGRFDVFLVVALNSALCVIISTILS